MKNLKKSTKNPRLEGRTMNLRTIPKKITSELTLNVSKEKDVCLKETISGELSKNMFLTARRKSSRTNRARDLGEHPTSRLFSMEEQNLTIYPKWTIGNLKQSMRHLCTFLRATMRLAHHPIINGWDWFCIVTIFATIAVTPLIGCFDAVNPGFWAVAVFCDIVFLFDILLRFFLPYEKHGIVVTHRKAIALQYLLGRRGDYIGIIDLLTVFPVELFALLATWKLPLANVLAGFRFSRLFRAYRIVSFFSRREEDIGSHTFRHRLAKYLIICLLFTHVAACFWYRTSCIGNNLPTTDQVGTNRTSEDDLTYGYCLIPSWAHTFEQRSHELKDEALAKHTNNTMTSHEIHKAHLHEVAKNMHKPGKFRGEFIRPFDLLNAYTVSLYWAVATTTSTGYGDIYSVTISEVVLASVVMLCGTLLFYGMLVGGLTSIVTNLDKQRAGFISRLNNVKAIMDEMDITDELRLLVVGYYKYMWVRYRGANKDRLFEGLPPPLQRATSLQLNHKVLAKASIFANVGKGPLRMISLKMKHVSFLPGQVITTAGDISHQMIYIHKGMIEVLGDDGKTCIALLKRGRIVGEICLVVSVPRTATMRAACHCDLVVLDKNDIREVARFYPNVTEKMREVADHRYERVEEAAKGVEKQNDSTLVVNHQIPDKVNEIRKVEKHDGLQSKQENVNTVSSLLHRTFRRNEIRFNEIFGSDIINRERHSLIRRHRTLILDKDMEIFESEKDRLWRFHKHYISPFVRMKESVCNKWFVLKNTLINPESRMAFVWETTILSLALLQGAEVIFMASFMTNGTIGIPLYNRPVIGALFKGVGWFIDLLNALDIVFQLRTAVYTPNGILNDFDEIVKHYVRTPRIVLDVLACLPLEVAVAYSHTLFAFFKLNRVLKLYRVPLYFSKKEGSIEYNIRTVRIFKFLIYVALCTHTVGCVWFFQACGLRDKCRPDSWAAQKRFDFNVNTSLGVKYASSVYWATTTMSSTGFGDVSAHNDIGRLVAVAAMIIGIGLWGYLQAVLASSLSVIDISRVEFQSKVVVVKKFMQERSLDSELVKTAIKYLTLLWRTHRHQSHQGETLFVDVPRTLQKDLVYCEYGEYLNNIPFLRDVGEEVLRDLCMKVQTFIYLPKTFLVTAGDVGNELYIIKRGHCELLIAGKSSEVLFKLGPQNFFGDISLLFGTVSRHSVRAKTHVEALVLTRTDFLNVAKKYPMLIRQVCEADNNQHFLNQLVRDISDNYIRLYLEEKREALSKSVNHHQCMKRRHAMLNETSDGRASKTYKGMFCKFKPILPNGEKNHDYLDPYKNLHVVGKAFACLLMPLSILPTGLLCKALEYTKLFLSLLMIITCTIWFTFEPFFSFGDIGVALTIMCFLNVLFMYAGFHTAYYENSVLVTHPVATAKHYLRTNFLLDFIGTVPVYLFAFTYYVVTGVRIDAASMNSSFFSLFYLVQFYRFPVAFAYYESLIDKSTGLIRFVKFVLYMVIFTHLLTCTMHMFACPPAIFLDPDRESVIMPPVGVICYKKSWILPILSTFPESFMKTYTCKSNCSYAIPHDISKYGAAPPDFGGVSFYYINALYWASATTLSVGYGDIYAISVVEMVFSMIIMASGIIFYAYIIAAVAASMANADASRSAFQGKLNALRVFMKDFFIDEQLRKRIIMHYEHAWHRTNGIESNDVLQGLPHALWADVTYNLYKHAINKVSVFQNANKGFKKLLSLSIRPQSFLEGEFIVRRGDIGQVMFFIHNGTVEVCDEHGNKVGSDLGPGHFFGEVCILFGIPRTASFRAKDRVDVFSLDRAKLFEAMNLYPTFKSNLFSIALLKRLRMSGQYERDGVADMNKDQLNEYLKIQLWRHVAEFDRSRSPTASPAHSERSAHDYLYNSDSDESLDSTIEIPKSSASCFHLAVSVKSACTLMKRRASEAQTKMARPSQLDFSNRKFVPARKLSKSDTTTVKVTDFDHDAKNKRGTKRTNTNKSNNENECSAHTRQLHSMDSMKTEMSPNNDGRKYGNDAFCGFCGTCTSFQSLKNGRQSVEHADRKRRNFIEDDDELLTLGRYLTQINMEAEVKARLKKDKAKCLRKENYGYVEYLSGVTRADDLDVYENLRQLSAEEQRVINAFANVFGQREPKHLQFEIGETIKDSSEFSNRLKECNPSLFDNGQDVFVHLPFTDQESDEFQTDCAIDIELGHAVSVTGVRSDVTTKRPKFSCSSSTKDGAVNKNWNARRHDEKPKERKPKNNKVGPVPNTGTTDKRNEQNVANVRNTVDSGTVTPAQNQTSLDETRNSDFSGQKINSSSWTTTKVNRVKSPGSNTVRLEVTVEAAPEFCAEPRESSIFETPFQVLASRAKQSQSEEGFIRRFSRRLLLWNRFIIYPYRNKAFKYFRTVSVFVNFLSSVLLIFDSTFAAGNEDPLHLVLFYITCVLFGFEIYIRFHVSFQDSSGMSCRDFTAVYRRYLYSRTGLMVDLVKEFPLEFVSVFISDKLTAADAFTYLRLNRVLRVVRCIEYMKEWESELNINVLLVRLCKYAIILLTTVHSLACAWCALACPHNTCHYGSWAVKRGVDRMDSFNRYSTAVYWTIATMTSTGYGDIRAYLSIEKGYAAFVMFTGKLMFGFILATISATLSNIEMTRMVYTERFDAIRTHLNDQDVPPKMQRHVIAYFRHMWRRNCGYDIKKLLDDAPFTLQSEFFYCMAEDFFRKIPVLKKVSQAFLYQLSVHVRHVILIEGDYVVRKGDVETDIFYIHRGKCAVVEDKSEDTDAHDLQEGDVVGQLNLVFRKPSCASIRCETHVDILALSRASLDEVKSMFPECAKIIRKNARELYGKYGKTKTLKAKESFLTLPRSCENLCRKKPITST